MIGETVGVIRPTTVEDRYGDTVTEYPTTAQRIIRHCAVDPGGTTEILDGRTAVVTHPTLYVRGRADLRPTDRLQVRGRIYEVGGEPALWRNPYTGAVLGMVVPLGEAVG